MGKLLLFELRKLARQKSLYICFAVGVVLLILNAAALALLDNMLQQENGEFIGEVMGAGGFEMQTLFGISGFTKNALSNSSFFLLLGVIITLYCCDDFSNGTIKNIYAKGYSRTNVYFSKYLFSLALSLVLAVLYIILAYIIGAIFAKSDNSDNLAAIMVCQLVMVAGYHGIFFSVSMMIRKIGGSLAINILAPMFFGLILALLTTLVRAIAKVDNFDFGYIWFDSAFTELNEIPVKTSVFVRSVLLGIIYAAGFVTLGYFVNRKRDV